MCLFLAVSGLSLERSLLGALLGSSDLYVTLK